jgi:hypothetical protein
MLFCFEFDERATSCGHSYCKRRLDLTWTLRQYFVRLGAGLDRKPPDGAPTEAVALPEVRALAGWVCLRLPTSIGTERRIGHLIDSTIVANRLALPVAQEDFLPGL